LYYIYFICYIKVSTFHFKHLKHFYQGYDAVLISLPGQPASNQSESRIKCFTTKAIIFLREEDF
ncbi:hypothetical protein TSAR_013863, partial [Trichomalopsis sarcophagae]